MRNTDNLIWAFIFVVGAKLDKKNGYGQCCGNGLSTQQLSEKLAYKDNLANVHYFLIRLIIRILNRVLRFEHVKRCNTTEC